MNEAAKRVRHELYRRAVRTAADKWKGPLPKGWTDESRKKFWNTLTSGAPKHKVTECIKKMEGKVSNAGAFCASLADRSIPGWRQEAAKERRKKKKAFAAKALTDFEKEYGYEPGPDGQGLLQGRYDYDQIPQAPTKERPRSMIPGKDQLGLDPKNPLSRKRLGTGRDPLAFTEEQKEKERKEVEEYEEKAHSQVPGTDNMPMEEDHRVGSSQWITRDEMENLCPPCAVRMKKAGFTKVHVKLVRRMLLAQVRTSRYNPQFLKEMEGRKFRSPAGNDVQFGSLPPEEQHKVYQQWAARQQSQQQPQERQQQPRQQPKKKEYDSAWERGDGGRGQRKFAPEYWFSSLSDQEKGALSEWVRIDPDDVAKATGIERKKLDEYSSGGARDDELDLDDVTWLAGHLDSQGDTEKLEKLHDYVREKTSPVIREIQLGNLEKARETKRRKREERKKSKKATVSRGLVYLLAPRLAFQMRTAGMTRIPTVYFERQLRTARAA